MLHKEGHESQIKCPADKFFSMFNHDILDLPNAMPGSYKGVKVLEGDGKTLGTVRLRTYVLPSDPTKVLTAKELLVELDVENRSITFKFLAGDVLEDYVSFTVKLSVTPTADGGSLVKWVLEYEKKDDHSPHPYTHIDFFALISSHFDALLHKADEYIGRSERSVIISCAHYVIFNKGYVWSYRT